MKIVDFIESSAEVFGDFRGKDVRIGEARRVFEAFVAEPEDVEASRSW